MSNPFFIFAYLVSLSILCIAIFVLFDGLRSKGKIARALNMVLFLVTIPRENQSGEGQDRQKPEKELRELALQIAAFKQRWGTFASEHQFWEDVLIIEKSVKKELKALEKSKSKL